MAELIVGYTIIAVLDTETRPEHRHRNGTTYYRQPREGQRGFDDMPRPPLESPNDGSVCAWNCRCHLAPLMIAPDTVPVGGFETAEGKLVSDPLVFSDWWKTAGEKRRRMVAGARRYSLVQDQLGTEPAWEDFIDPESGDLLSLDALRTESPGDRAARVAGVRQIFASRREALRRAYLGAGV